MIRRVRLALIYRLEWLIDLLWVLLNWFDGFELTRPRCQECGAELRPAYADRAWLRNPVSLWCSDPREEPNAVAAQMRAMFRTVAGMTDVEWQDVERALASGAPIGEVMSRLIEWADTEAQPWKETSHRGVA